MPNVTSQWPTPIVGPQQTTRPITIVEELERLAPGSVVQVVQDPNSKWERWASYYRKSGRAWTALDGDGGDDEFRPDLDDAYILAHAVVHGKAVGSITVVWDAAAEPSEEASGTSPLTAADLARQNSALVEDARAAGERLIEVAGTYPPGHHVTLAEGVRTIVEAHHQLKRRLDAANERIAELEAEPGASSLPDADAFVWTDTRGYQFVALRVGNAWQVNGSPRTEQQLITTLHSGGGVPRPLDFRANS